MRYGLVPREASSPAAGRAVVEGQDQPRLLLLLLLLLIRLSLPTRRLQERPDPTQQLALVRRRAQDKEVCEARKFGKSPAGS